MTTFLPALLLCAIAALTGCEATDRTPKKATPVAQESLPVPPIADIEEAINDRDRRVAEIVVERLAPVFAERDALRRRVRQLERRVAREPVCVGLDEFPWPSRDATPSSVEGHIGKEPKP